MTRKNAITLLFFFDLLCFGGLWIGYHEFQRILVEIANQADMIKFGNRLGFFVLGLFLPLIHIFIIVEYFRPALIHKHERLMNLGAIFLLIALLSAGIISSYWIKSRVENAGYLYCRNASGISALARTLVYTKNMDICEEVLESKIKTQK